MHQFLIAYPMLHTENRNGSLSTGTQTFPTLAVSMYEPIVLEIFHSKQSRKKKLQSVDELFPDCEFYLLEEHQCFVENTLTERIIIRKF